jgi:hypothetical protein
MQFFFAFIEDNIGALFEIDQEDFFHFIGNFVEETSQVFMIIIFV